MRCEMICAEKMAGKPLRLVRVGESEFSWNEYAGCTTNHKANVVLKSMLPKTPMSMTKCDN
jgi:hypothetical protein